MTSLIYDMRPKIIFYNSVIKIKKQFESQKITCTGLPLKTQHRLNK